MQTAQIFGQEGSEAEAPTYMRSNEATKRQIDMNKEENEQERNLFETVV